MVVVAPAQRRDSFDREAGAPPDVRRAVRALLATPGRSDYVSCIV